MAVENVNSYYSADGVGMELRTYKLHPTEDFGIWLIETGANESIEDAVWITLGPGDAVRFARDILDAYGQES